MAEVELAALAKQCLDRRIGSAAQLTRQVDAWEGERNERMVGIKWQFTTAEDKLMTEIEQLRTTLQEVLKRMESVAATLTPQARGNSRSMSVLANHGGSFPVDATFSWLPLSQWPGPGGRR